MEKFFTMSFFVIVGKKIRRQDRKNLRKHYILSKYTQEIVYRHRQRFHVTDLHHFASSPGLILNRFSEWRLWAPRACLHWSPRFLELWIRLTDWVCHSFVKLPMKRFLVECLKGNISPTNSSAFLHIDATTGIRSETKISETITQSRIRNAMSNGVGLLDDRISVSIDDLSGFAIGLTCDCWV